MDGHDVAVGNVKILRGSGQTPQYDEEYVRGLKRAGDTVMFVLEDGKVAGYIGVADPIKDSTKEVVSLLHERKVRIVMLTGDNAVTAEAVAKELGLIVLRPSACPRTNSPK